MLQSRHQPSVIQNRALCVSGLFCCLNKHFSQKYINLHSIRHYTDCISPVSCLRVALRARASHACSSRVCLSANEKTSSRLETHTSNRLASRAADRATRKQTRQTFLAWLGRHLRIGACHFFPIYILRFVDRGEDRTRPASSLPRLTIMEQPSTSTGSSYREAQKESAASRAPPWRCQKQRYSSGASKSKPDLRSVLTARRSQKKKS